MPHHVNLLTITESSSVLMNINSMTTKGLKMTCNDIKKEKEGCSCEPDIGTTVVI